MDMKIIKGDNEKIMESKVKVVHDAKWNRIFSEYNDHKKAKKQYNEVTIKTNKKIHKINVKKTKIVYSIRIAT